jgi:hypothetical protein
VKFLRSLIIYPAVILALAQTGSAQTVFDKIKGGAKKAGDVVGKSIESVGETIESTAELAADEGTPEQSRNNRDAMAEKTLAQLFSKNKTANELYNASAGYAVFDTRKVATLGVAAGFGRGVAVSKETVARTYMNMGTGGVGLSLGIGGFESQVVILFENADGFEDFVANGYDATAEGGSMFGDDKAEQQVRFVNGRSIFVLTKKGWKVSASAAGTKYWPDKDLN